MTVNNDYINARTVVIAIEFWLDFNHFPGKNFAIVEERWSRQIVFHAVDGATFQITRRFPPVVTEASDEVTSRTRDVQE